MVLAGGLLVAAPALSQASFHETKIREVSGGTGVTDTAYVELQMIAAGQNLFGGHDIDIYSGAGVIQGSCPLANVAQSANQRTILIGDTGVPQRDVTCDLSANLENQVFGDGAVCFADASPPDCVSWRTGSSTDPIPNLPAPGAGVPIAGTMGDGIPHGQAAHRNILAGCPTLLEQVDDTNVSRSDFALGAIAPTPNSATPAETPCLTTKTAKKKCKKKKKGKKGTAAPAAKKKCKKKKKKK